MQYDRARFLPSLWMSREQIEVIAQYDPDTDPNSGAHMGPLSSDVKASILYNIDAALLRSVRWDGAQWVFASESAPKSQRLGDVLKRGIREAWESLDRLLAFPKQKKRIAIEGVFGDEGGRPVEGEPVTVLGNPRRGKPRKR